MSNITFCGYTQDEIKAMAAEIERLQLRIAELTDPAYVKGRIKIIHELHTEIERVQEEVTALRLVATSHEPEVERLRELLAEGIECRGNATSDEEWAKRARRALEEK
jgi:hypothetical protein